LARLDKCRALSKEYPAYVFSFIQFCFQYTIALRGEAIHRLIFTGTAAFTFSDGQGRAKPRHCEAQQGLYRHTARAEAIHSPGMGHTPPVFILRSLNRAEANHAAWIASAHDARIISASGPRNDGTVFAALLPCEK